MAESALWLILSTCCRPGEIGRARWADVDFDARTWMIPTDNAKNGRPHVVHLSDFALAKLRQLEQYRSSEWLYPNRDGSGHVDTKSLQKQFRDRQLTKRQQGRTSKPGTLVLSGGEWRAHDLRRTGATLMGELGVRADVIERCLNHAGEDKLIRTYQHQKLIPERIEAFDRLGERLELPNSKTVIAGRFGRATA